MKNAEKQLYQLLENIGMPIRPSYNIAEVCCVLGIGIRTFHRMIIKKESSKNNKALKSFIKQNERRVTFSELAAYIARNNTFKNRKTRNLKK
jgi:hypothetical protein